ncbi:hypothetical protein C2E23DRAFT_729789, partial [Lenzites betulinus]
AMPVFSRCITALIVSNMDLPTILVFRTTSRENLCIAKQELRKTLRSILSQFVPKPGMLAAKLNRLNAVVGGSAGLAFFLRHLDVCPTHLDIFIPIGCMPPFFHHILTDQSGTLIFPVMPTNGVDPLPENLPDEECFTFRTPCGCINLWQSEAHTPFLPIVTGPTSLHILYVSPRHFGCAYPKLLFSTRALVARPDTSGFDSVVSECVRLKIDLRFFTNGWEDLASHGPCASKVFLCPSQQRTFSDAGSLRGRMNPLVDGELDAEVVWRRGDSMSLSPTSTLCIDEESMDVDDPEAMWADINESTPAVETWVPNTFFHRLKKILSYVDPLNARFNVGDIPKDCTWGAEPWASRLTCNNQVIQIWAVGHLKCMWFYATDEDTRPCVRIALDLLRDVDATGVRRLMAMSTVLPRNSWLASLDFCADKHGHIDNRIFRDVYDARETYTAKNLMPKLHPTDLTIGDVVLVECSLVRKRVDRAAPGQWSMWTTSFQLQALSVLMSRKAADERMLGQDDISADGFSHQL